VSEHYEKVLNETTRGKSEKFMNNGHDLKDFVLTLHDLHDFVGHELGARISMVCFRCVL